MNIEGNSINATLEINEKHKIFLGHFPEHPVVPGVCIFQMVKEIVELSSEKELQLSTASEIKFLGIIDPNEKKTLRMSLNYEKENDGINVSASLLKDTTLCFKFKGIFKRLESAE
ncbi:MAG: 3-hydroxyacyl-ACP dehydratase [Ginsengibacter sp.]